MRFSSIDSLWYVAAGSALALVFVSFYTILPSELIAAGFFLSALPTLSAFIKNNGGVRGGVALALLLVFVYGVYAVAVSTGFPFGSIIFGDGFGRKLFGSVPWSLLFIWAPALIAASSIAAHVFRSPLVRFFGTAAFVVLFDAILNPVALRLGFWSFASATGGLPLFNYFGWILAGLVASAIIFFALGHDWFALGKKVDEYARSLLITIPFFSLIAIEFRLFFSVLAGILACAFLLRMADEKGKDPLQTAAETIIRTRA